MTTRARIATALTAAGLPGVTADYCRAGGGYWYFHGGEADRWRSQASPWHLPLTHDVADFVEAALALSAENADELADDDWRAANNEGDIVVIDND